MAGEDTGDYPRVEQLIVVQVPRGKGTHESPFRRVTRVHRFDGELVAEMDPCAEPPQ